MNLGTKFCFTYWLKYLIFLLSTGSPIVSCDATVYGNSLVNVVVPTPKYAGFQNPVTVTYSYNNIQIASLDGSIPYHTLPSLAFLPTNQRSINVVVSDGLGSSRSCNMEVYPYAPGGKPNNGLTLVTTCLTVCIPTPLEVSQTMDSH